MEKTSALSHSPLHTEHSGKRCNFSLYFSLFAHKSFIFVLSIYYYSVFISF